MIKAQFLSFLQKQSAGDLFSGSVLVMKNGSKFLEYSSGYSNQEKQILNSSKTIFNIGSIDKIFTGVVVAQLAQKNKLSFQDKISKYLPLFPKAIADKLTIHQILTHTEGFPPYFNKKYIVNRLQLHTVNDYLDLFKDESLLFNPGEKYQYSNSGYVVLGAIIEAITGKSYYDYIKEEVFMKSGMSEYNHFEPDFNNPLFAIGYTQRKLHSQEMVPGPRRENTEELPPISSPAGGGYSTCEDLYKFSHALLNNKLLKEEMTKLVLTPKIVVGTKDDTILHYGYGFQILDVGCGRFRYGHAGAFAGVNARLDMYPWLGYTTVVLSNYDQPAAFKIANEFGRLILI
jgi:CubicO group peptidase (beta-lactamase class C family)